MGEVYRARDPRLGRAILGKQAAALGAAKLTDRLKRKRQGLQ